MRSLELMRLLGWAAGVAACVAAIYVAAGAALQRPDALRINGAAAASSGPQADYSVDERATRRGQLDPRIIGAIIADEAGGEDASDTTAEASPASDILPLPTRASFVAPAPTTWVRATSTPQPHPTASDTPEPEPTATHTNEPEPTPTDTPEPEPTDTPEPEPTDTPEPEPTATPTPPKCRKLDFGNLKNGHNEQNNGKRCPTPTTDPDE